MDRFHRGKGPWNSYGLTAPSSAQQALADTNDQVNNDDTRSVAATQGSGK